MIRALQRSLGLQALKQCTVHVPAFYSVQVVVPSLGESITDGAIAAVLKKAGDAVKENETIVQIETDKVTIDIKSPSDGTILGVVVQEQDTVVPGQLVATVDDAAAKANLIGATPPASASQATSAAPAPAAAAAATGAAAPAAAHRTSGIRFPPRVTPDGVRISSLPASEAHAIIQQLGSSTGSAAAAPGASAAAPAAAAAAPAKPPAAAGRDAASAAFASSAGRPAAPAAAPSKFASSSMQLNSMPKRRELTEREMELIELGGAGP